MEKTLQFFLFIVHHIILRHLTGENSNTLPFRENDLLQKLKLELMIILVNLRVPTKLQVVSKVYTIVHVHGDTNRIYEVVYIVAGAKDLNIKHTPECVRLIVPYRGSCLMDVILYKLRSLVRIERQKLLKEQNTDILIISCCGT